MSIYRAGRATPVISVAAATLLLAMAAPASAAVTKSTTFAGYQLVSTKIRTATATFVVPRITCVSNESGVGPSIVMVSKVNTKTNTYTYSGAGIGVACVNQKPVYESILIVNGSSSNDLTLHRGDHVTVTVTMVSTGSKAILRDTTTHQSKTRTGSGRSAAQVYIGDNGLQISSHNVRLDPFSTTTVSAATINGNSLSAEHAQRTIWVRSTTTLVKAGVLSGGHSFTLTFEHS
jgi:hypothetical protein